MQQVQAQTEQSFGDLQAAVTASEMDGKYLTFYTDRQLYGVPISDVVQIVGMQEVTQVPEFPYYAKGIINLRGAIIPVIDVRLRFNKAEKEYDERTCIIVTLIRDTAIGFIVDAVDAVTDIEESNISPPPTVGAETASSACLTGVARHEGRVVLLLNTQKLLSDDAMASFTENM